MKLVIQKYLGRIILGLFTLVILPILPTVVDFVNSTFGFDWTQAEVVDYATNMAYGVAGLAAVWLANLGLWERSAAKTVDLFNEGKAYTDALEADDLEPPVEDVPPVPPGIKP